MIWFINNILWLMALIVCVPSAIFVLECLAAVFLRCKERSVEDASPRLTVAVLVPAHDEEAGIVATIESILPQLNADDRLLVVADNCSDATAQVAANAGAQVVQRDDLEHQGKGYALQRGLASLQENPPQVVVVMDADVHLEDEAIESLLRQVAYNQRPSQARYDLRQPASPSPQSTLSHLATIFKNTVRPTGLKNLGLPCQLMGTGMAFPWEVLTKVQLGTSHLVEDMQLGAQLTCLGYPPSFCPRAQVRSQLPVGRRAAHTQRTRWEHGHLKMIGSEALPLVWRGLLRGKVTMMALGLDMAVPPLSLLVMVLLALLMLTGVASVWGIGRGPALLLGICLTSMGLAVLLGWWAFARDCIPASRLASIPKYMLSKISIYFSFWTKRQTQWVRTQRDHEAVDSSEADAQTDVQAHVRPVSGQHQPWETIDLMGVPLHAITEAQCVDHILESLDNGQGGWVVTPNLDHHRRLVCDKDFALLCQGADLFVPDGMPLIWASYLQGSPLPQRVAGSNLISSLSQAAATRGCSVFLLGGDAGTAQAAGEQLQKRFAQLKIAGTFCPPVGFEQDPQQVQEMTQQIKQSQANIVFVALGSPKQERLIAGLKEVLPKAWWLGVGISFSFLSGQVKRAPRWMQVMGLEWFYRLIQEPNRLARRYLIEDIPHGVGLMCHAIKTRFHPTR